MSDVAVNHSRMRRMNCVAVLRQLHVAGPLSRIELAQRLALDAKTLTNLTRDLIRRRFVAEAEVKMLEGRGRPRQMLRIRGENMNALGVHVTEDEIRCAIINLAGEIHHLQTTKIEKMETAASLARKLHRIVQAVFDANNAPLLGAGIAHPGMDDKKTGRVIRCVNLPALEGMRPGRIVAKVVPGRMVLLADVPARALAEHWFGVARNLQDYIYINLGVGIGCAFVKNGKADLGFYGRAGELGHMIIAPHGGLCSCGRRGCLETVASLEHIGHHPQHSFLRRLDAAATAVGISIANLICLLNPHDIILGGKSLRLEPRLFEAIRTAVDAAQMKEFAKTFTLRESQLGETAALLGSVVRILDSVFQE